ncbi:MAG: hypothetical protein FWD36_00685 [Treponema sp.]|nr:hypothetical protein [Treponema sp.]
MKHTIHIALIITGIFAALCMTSCPDPYMHPMNMQNTNKSGVGTPDRPGKTYRVYVQSSANGVVKLDKASGIYMQDELVILSIEPNATFHCSYLEAVITSVASAPISGKLSDSTRTFKMPNANVYIMAGFVTGSLNTIGIGEQLNGRILSVSHTAASRDNRITVTVEPNEGFELEPGGLKIIGDRTAAVASFQGSGRRGEYSFFMINEPVTLHALFFDPAVEQYRIVLATPNDQSGNAIVVKGLAAAGERVTMIMYLQDDHTLLEPPTATWKNGSLTVTQDTPLDPTRWSFTMPAAGLAIGDVVSIGARWRMVPMYTVKTEIAAASPGEGTFTVNGLNRVGKIAAGEEVTLTLKLNDSENFFYKPNSIQALSETGGNFTNQLAFIEDPWIGDTLTWKFLLPAAPPVEILETITVSTIIEGIEAHLVTLNGFTDGNGKKAATLALTPWAAGKDVLPGQLKIREGKMVSATLIHDPDDYTFTSGSFNVTRTGGGGNVSVVRDGDTKLSFMMLPEPITISATLTALPFHTITTQSVPANTGTINVAIASPDGKPKENARAGYIVTLTATPARGYAAASAGPTVSPTQPLTQVGNAWSFTMPNQNVTVSWNFVDRGHLEIYKGGPRLPGLFVTQSAYPYGNAINFADWWDTNPAYQNAGRNGGRAIRIGPNSRSIAAGQTYTNAEIGFGLEVPQAVDVSWAGAISFWMRRESGGDTANWAGFGEGGNLAIWHGNGNNSQFNHPITAQEVNGWTRYIIPVPYPKEGMNLKRVFFWKGNAGGSNTIWLIDDIEFIPSTQIDMVAITIADSYPSEITPNVPVEAHSLANINRVGFRYTTNAAAGAPTASATMWNSTGSNVNYSWGSWVPNRLYSYNVYGADGSLSGTTVTPLRSGGNFELSMSLTDIKNNRIESNRMRVDIEDDSRRILENFEVNAPASNGARGYWDEMLWRARSTGTNAFNGAYSGDYRYLRDPTGRPGEAENQRIPARAGRNLPAPVDISAYTNVVFYIKGNIASIESDTFSFSLSMNANYANGAGSGTYKTANLGTFRSVDFTIAGRPSLTNGFKRVEIPIANFGFSPAQLTRITGWAVSVMTYNGCTQPGDGYEYIIYIDDIAVER